MPLSREPHRLKKPFNNGIPVNFLLWLRVLGWWSGGFELPRWTLSPLT